MSETQSYSRVHTLTKLKSGEVIPAQHSGVRRFEMPLSEVLVEHQYLEQYKRRRPQEAKQVRDWIGALQSTVQTSRFECKYYLEVSVRHSGLFSRQMPPIRIPVTIYH